MFYYCRNLSAFKSLFILLDLFGPSLIVSPRLQSPIKGDANIARYLCRKFAPDLYEALGENDVALIDHMSSVVAAKVCVLSFLSF